jgi:membrane-associated PAP2 superfamily phosphatase
MFVNIPRDWSRNYTLTFRGQNFPAMVGMTLLTGALVVTDNQTWQLSDRLYRNSSVARSTSDIFEYMGDGRPQFGLAGAFAVYGFVADDPRALRTASQTVEAILACGVVVQVLKHMTGRESPNVSTRPGGVWNFFPNQVEYHKHVPHYDAFPSGHIATALATVTVVVENYPEWTWVKPVGYSIVALIGISMANTGIHWYSDYPLGLALGYSFGMLAAHPEGLHEEKAEPGAPTGFVVSPIVSAERTGVSIALTF